MGNNVTMRDLGKRLGVSAVTISKALAGKSGVSEEMRQKIIRLADEVGYVNPNAPAAPVKQGMDVGILVPDQFFSEDAFYAMFYKKLLQTLTDAGHFGLMELVSEEAQHNLTLPNLLRGRRVDALVLLGQPAEKYARLLASQGLPTVTLDFFYPDLPADAIVGDGAGGTAKLTYHLIAQGHRDIGFFGNAKATSSIMERYLGFSSAMMMNDLPIRSEWVLQDRDCDNIMTEIVLPETLPTAFVCNCDVVARNLVRALRNAGKRVPEDVSVVGYDDFNNRPGSLPLTTFRANIPVMCRIAVKLLEQRRSGDDSPRCRIVVGGEAVYRDSVAARK